MDAVTLAQMQYSSGATKETVTGNAPITLSDAVAKPIASLTQTGLCTQASTPTPSSPVPIKCNNGEIKYGKPITIDSARITAYISEDGLWVADTGYCIAIPVTVGNKYAIRMTETDSDIVGTIFRWGFTNSTTPSGQQLSQWVRSTPQDTQFAELTADNTYLIIQLSASKAAGVVSNGYLVVQEQTIYVDGTPEVLTVTDADSNTQTASVTDLFSVYSYADAQDVIRGAVTHNVGIKVLDGTENWKKLTGQSAFYVSLPEMLVISEAEKGLSTHYNGSKATNANLPDNSIKLTYSSDYGMILIKDTAYSTKDDFSAYLAAQYAAGTPVIIVYPLATPYTEQVTAQPLTTSVGTNTVSVTAEVSPVNLASVYKIESESGSTSIQLLQYLLRTTQRRTIP